MFPIGPFHQALASVSGSIRRWQAYNAKPWRAVAPVAVTSPESANNRQFPFGGMRLLCRSCIKFTSSRIQKSRLSLRCRCSQIASVFCSTERKAVVMAEMLSEHLDVPCTRHAALGENDRSATGYLPKDGATLARASRKWEHEVGRKSRRQWRLDRHHGTTNRAKPRRDCESRKDSRGGTAPYRPDLISSVG